MNNIGQGGYGGSGSTYGGGYAGGGNTTQTGYGTGNTTQTGYGAGYSTGGTYKAQGMGYGTGSHNTPQPPKKDKKPMGVGRLIAFALIFGLVAGGTFTGISYGSNWLLGKNNTSNNSSVSKVELPSSAGTNVDTSSVNINAVDVSAVVDAAMPSIVSITNISVKEYSNWFGQTGSQKSKSLGTGFIIHQSESELLIATNNHVINNATELTVGFCDGKAAEATVKDIDDSTDMAVIAVSLSNMEQSTISTIRIAKLGDSTSLKVGETAIAIGNALGYGQSVTTGVISALDRTINNDGVSYKVIQTDAAINPGNSGGALLNKNGEVIGINNAKAIVNYVEGVCYAIPMASALPLFQRVINGQSSGGQAAAPSSQAQKSNGDSILLGISGVNIGESESSKYNVPQGVYISKVEVNSVAEAAGLKEQDVIYEMDGKSIKTQDDIRQILASHKAGDKIEIKLYTKDGRAYVQTTVTAQF
ncbi:MAG: PDZ domain-containing protein [Lachnospiraceae bacterium]|nr:PDZ domain-containing protein [Lachnospiraceae bacterium]